MHLEAAVTHAASALLMPPFSLMVLCALGLVLRRRWPGTGLTLGLLSLIMMTVLSTRAGAMLVVAPLERLAAPAVGHSGAQAIVVLGAGCMANAPEYGGLATPGLISLARIRYAAKLHRATRLPILVTGGKRNCATEPEAALMARVLQEEFAIPVKWLEPDAVDTAHNAEYSKPLLRQAGVRRILLVTDALHMPRAAALFAHSGWEVAAAPTLFHSSAPLSKADLLPNARALALSQYAIHEWLGLAWIRWQYAERRHS